VARLAPSILSADFAALGDAVDAVTAQADLLHVDVMDGHFVPNITIGPAVVASLRRHTDLYFDCHLMITNPEDYLEQFRQAGADGCSVHVEVGRTRPLIDQMRSLGLDVGLAVNPETPFESYSEWLDEIDLLLLMTVHPGFGGQAFIAEVLPKISQTRREIDRLGLAVPIEVDGGIDLDTAPVAAAAGASVFVAGSAVFGEPDPAAAAYAIRRAADRATPPGAAEPRLGGAGGQESGGPAAGQPGPHEDGGRP
jgi:ribulose-phosphate 3-epimerase